MVKALKKFGRTAKALYRDEQGADMIEYILVLAAIALPILAVVLWFGRDIGQWAKSLWESGKSREGTDPDEF